MKEGEPQFQNTPTVKKVKKVTKVMKSEKQ
jgi:hypothetical protein